MTTIKQYTYENINIIKNDNNFILEKETTDVIIELEKLLGLENMIEKIPLKRSDRSFDRKKNKRGYKMPRGSSLNDMNNDDWESIRNFKPTEKAELSNFDKNFNEIRADLNKISNSTFTTIKSSLIEKIVNFLNEEEKNEENQQKMGEMIFNICSNNRFLSGLYAELYVDLVGHFDMFGDILDNYIVRFKESLNNIEYIDPENDYDAFCEYNRLNDERKSHSTFLINLMKHDMISKTSILELILNLQKISFEFIDQDNKVHEVEEITENIFLLVQNSKEVLNNTPEWDTIKNNITSFATLKAKEHISLSSRCVFKYMDMKQ